MPTETIVKDYNISNLKESSVPQIWGKNPLFAAVKQSQPTEVQLSDGAIWRMGVQPPFGNLTHKDYLRGLDIRHAEFIFKLFAFFRDNNIEFNHKVDISYYKLLKIIGWERSKPNFEKLKDVLGDLSSIWTTIVTEKEIKTFRILSASANWDPQNPEHASLEYISFDPTFLEFLGKVELFLSIRLDILNIMTSNIAKTIYLYIPSRALKNTKATPFKITLINLFDQIKINIPKYKSARFKTMTQHKKSVIAQLDNALINYNKKLKVSLEETKDGKDYNFCAWVEQITEKDFAAPGQDSLRTWFINGQGKRAGLSKEFENIIKNKEPLDIYQTESLQEAEINIKKSRIFLEQSKALLGTAKFNELIADVKGRVLHDHYTKSSNSIKSPIAYLITLIRSELLGELPLF